MGYFYRTPGQVFSTIQDRDGEILAEVQSGCEGLAETSKERWQKDIHHDVVFCRLCLIHHGICTRVNMPGIV